MSELIAVRMPLVDNLKSVISETQKPSVHIHFDAERVPVLTITIPLNNDALRVVDATVEVTPEIKAKYRDAVVGVNLFEKNIGKITINEPGTLAFGNGNTTLLIEAEFETKIPGTGLGFRKDFLKKAERVSIS